MVTPRQAIHRSVARMQLAWLLEDGGLTIVPNTQVENDSLVALESVGVVEPTADLREWVLADERKARFLLGR